MSKSTKIAVSLDPLLLVRIERARARTGESRSALVSRALTLLASHTEMQSKVSRYVRAYREHPETAEDIPQARASSRRVLARLPWTSR